MRRYVARDYPEISGWYEARGLVAPGPDALPMVGVIVPGVAASFLYRTDSSLCFIDNMISNPVAPLRARSRAVTRMAEALEEEAHAQGYRTIVLTSKRHGVIARARAIGYGVVGTYSMLAKEVRATNHAEPGTILQHGEV